MKSSFLHLVIAFSICFAMILGYGFWFAALKEKSAAAAELERQITAKTIASGRIASARASLSEIADQETSMRRYFVPETGVVAFITDLESRGQSQGAAVNVLSVSTKGAGSEKSLEFSIVIKGSFDAVMRTIGAIEYAPYAVSVSALTLQEDDEKSWHADLDLLVGSVSASAERSAAITP